MSLLRSFSFSYPEDERIVMDLCVTLADITKEDMEKYKDYLSEVADAFLNEDEDKGKRIDTSKQFNLKAYALAVQKNQKLAKSKKSQKTLAIYEDDFDETVSIPAYCVPMSALPAAEGAGEAVELDIELQESIDELRKYNLELTARAGVDVIYALIASTRLTDDSLKKNHDVLRKVVTDYPEIGNSIQTVLTSGYQIDELFPEEVRKYDCNHGILRQKSSNSYIWTDDYSGC